MSYEEHIAISLSKSRIELEEDTIPRIKISMKILLTISQLNSVFFENWKTEYWNIWKSILLPYALPVATFNWILYWEENKHIYITFLNP